MVARKKKIGNFAHAGIESVLYIHTPPHIIPIAMMIEQTRIIVWNEVNPCSPFPTFGASRLLLGQEALLRQSLVEGPGERDIRFRVY